MVQLPKLDNKWLATAAPAKSNGKALSSAPASEKDSSPANVLSEPSVNNKSDLSSRNDFQSTLKNKLRPEAQPKDLEKPKDADGLESAEDSETVSLSDADSVAVATPVTTVAPQPMMMMKTPAVKAAQVTDQAQPMEHRLAWNSFLHKMKDKLGISAQDILSAFKSLTKEELAQPPEQNIAKLVQQLGLSDQQAAMAHQFFKELIVRTDSQPLNKDASLGLAAGPLATTSQQEIHQAKTEQSLQNMNDRFFMKPKADPYAMSPKIEKPTLGDDQKDSLAAIASGEKVEESSRPSIANDTGMVIPADVIKASQSQKMPNIENFSKEQMKPVAEVKPAAGMKPAAKVAAALDQMEMSQVESTPAAAASPMMTPKFISKNLSAPIQNLDSNVNNIPTAAQNPVAPIPVVPLAPKFGGAPDKNFDDGGDDSSNVMIDGDEAAIAGRPFKIDTNDVQGNKELGKAMPTMAIPELVQHAHVMVKDGGGEMKVVLTPDGLGEVAMKVSVKDGKVNVEMVTQSDEAKKMLETSFHSLRDGLNAHHLSLESIKVDSAPSLSTQLEQQYRDAQRHQAQQFLEQFHQDNRSWRQSYFDIPGAQTSRSQTDRTSVGPEMLSNPSATSRRLNLVA